MDRTVEGLFDAESSQCSQSPSLPPLSHTASSSFPPSTPSLPSFPPPPPYFLSTLILTISLWTGMGMHVAERLITGPLGVKKVLNDTSTSTPFPKVQRPLWKESKSWRMEGCHERPGHGLVIVVMNSQKLCVPA